MGLPVLYPRSSSGSHGAFVGLKASRYTEVVLRWLGVSEIRYFCVVKWAPPLYVGLQRELAKSLTCTTQPGLVSPGGGDQTPRYHLASLPSESGESLRHVGC